MRKETREKTKRESWIKGKRGVWDEGEGDLVGLVEDRWTLTGSEI